MPINDPQFMLRDLQRKALRGDPNAIAMLQEMQQVQGPQQSLGEKWGALLGNFIPRRAAPGDTGLMSPLQNPHTAAATGVNEQALQAPVGVAAPGAAQLATRAQQAPRGVQDLIGQEAYADAPVGVQDGSVGGPLASPEEVAGGSGNPLSGLLDMQDKIQSLRNAPITDMIPGRRPDIPDTPSSIDDQADMMTLLNAGAEPGLESVDYPMAGAPDAGGASGMMGGAGSIFSRLNAFLSSDQGKTLARGLFDFGGGAMAASGDRNATYGSVLGKGIQSASSSYDKRKARQEDVDFRDETRRDLKSYRDETVQLRGRQLDLTDKSLKRQEDQLQETIRYHQDLLALNRDNAAESRKLQAQGVDLKRRDIELSGERLEIERQRAERGDKDAQRQMYALVGNQVQKELGVMQDANKLEVENNPTAKPLTANDINTYRSEREWSLHSQYGTLPDFLKNQGYDKDSFSSEINGQINIVRNSQLAEDEKVRRVRELRARLKQGLVALQ